MLLIQSAPAQAATLPTAAVVFAVVTVAVLALILGFFALLFRYLRASREMLHAERLKAIEHGQPLEEGESPQAKFMHNAFWIAFWMVALIPSAAFSSAASVTKPGEQPLSLAITIWVCAGAASIAAVVCATVLIAVSRRSKSKAGESHVKERHDQAVGVKGYA
jgi:hypothetical protein